MTTRRDLLKLASALPAAVALSALSTSTNAHTESKAQAPHIEPGQRPLNILILGGTGFTGPHQVRYALARGHKVTLLNRGRKPQEWPADVEELIGDRENATLKALRGRKWDVCIDNPTSVPHWVRDVGKILKGKIDHYVFISTISVYRENDQANADESAATLAYEGKDKYAQTRESLLKNMELYGPLKAECEREARKWFGDKATIIRPGLIVGPGDETDRFSYWPVRIAKGGDVLAPPAQDPVQFIDARDLAEWTVRVAEQRLLGTFNATGPDYPLSAAALLYGIRASTTQGANLHFADAKFLEEHKVAPWSELPVWVPAEGEMLGFAQRSIAKAKAAGLSFRSLSDTTNATLAWFDAQPAERQATVRAGLKTERERELLALMR